MKQMKKAFTLVEILIVVIILGILAAIVIPQFTEASNDARESALKSDLQTLRSSVQLYKGQHTGYPDANNFVAQLTGKTDQDGTLNASGDYGPYLQSFPTNQFNSKATVQVESGTGSLGGGSHGWHFDTSSGMIRPDDDDHSSL